MSSTENFKLAHLHTNFSSVSPAAFARLAAAAVASDLARISPNSTEPRPAD
jgi:hypothetical protein